MHFKCKTWKCIHGVAKGFSVVNEKYYKVTFADVAILFIKKLWFLQKSVTRKATRDFIAFCKVVARDVQWFGLNLYQWQWQCVPKTDQLSHLLRVYMCSCKYGQGLRMKVLNLKGSNHEGPNIRGPLIKAPDEPLMKSLCALQRNLCLQLAGTWRKYTF